MNKKLINGLKYEKLAEEQLYDLSQWELVDIILAYRNELKRKEQECKALREEKAYTDMACKQFEEQLDQLKSENEELKKYEYHYLDKFLKLKDCLTEIKEIVENEMTPNCDTNIILQKISECEE